MLDLVRAALNTGLPSGAEAGLGDTYIYDVASPDLAWARELHAGSDEEAKSEALSVLEAESALRPGDEMTLTITRTGTVRSGRLGMWVLHSGAAVWQGQGAEGD